MAGHFHMSLTATLHLTVYSTKIKTCSPFFQKFSRLHRVWGLDQWTNCMWFEVRAFQNQNFYKGTELIFAWMCVSASAHVSVCSYTDPGIQLMLKEWTTGLLNSFMIWAIPLMEGCFEHNIQHNIKLTHSFVKLKREGSHQPWSFSP